jgi:hypothetical protein
LNLQSPKEKKRLPMTVEIKGTPPANILDSLNRSLTKSNWIGESDSAAVALAIRLATALDVSFDTGELKEVPALAQRLTVILQQLHLTTETRTQGKQEEENDGSEHLGNYLRLLKAAPDVAKPKPAKRGASSS